MAYKLNNYILYRYTFEGENFGDCPSIIINNYLSNSPMFPHVFPHVNVSAIQYYIAIAI